MGLGVSGLGPRGQGLCSPKPPWLLQVSYMEVPLVWVMAGLRVGRPVGVVPPWSVIAVAAYAVAHGHTTSTCDAGIKQQFSIYSL